VLRRVAATALLTICLAAQPLPGSASPTVARPTVGGAALSSTGTVVGRGAGVPFLPPVSASSFVVADLDTGDVLAARAAHAKRLPASTLKTLTAVALLPRLPTYRGYRATFADVNVEGSKVGVVAGHRYYADDLLRAMLIVSGNDAADSVASAAGGAGGAARSIAIMNDTAHRLQADDTHAVNPSGLDADGQTTSAYDLALIGRAGLKMPRFAAYVRTVRARFPAPGGSTFEIYNHNKLLTRYAGSIGVKGGYTVAARHTFVAAAQRDGHRIIVTVMHAEQLYADLTALLDWGFAADGHTPVVGRLVDPLQPQRHFAVGDPAAAAPAPGQPAAFAPIRRRNTSDLSLTDVAAVAVPLGAGGLLALTGAMRRRRRAVRVGEGLLRLP
jgi:D-alanyl-D-alanine carboxypeptidase (penicillin-binding protein 5/6)